MPTVYPLHYAAAIDTNWSVNPGACTDMSFFVHKQDGVLNSFVTDYQAQSSSLGFTVTGTDHLHSELFMQTNGTVRFLTFRKSDIDEYDSSGTRTNQGTGYNASTADWSVTAWGNQIIACNYLDATQSSTGTTFGALGGGAPKARYCASNLNFVMLADVNDGGSNQYTDMVWWSGLRNPNTFTPSLTTNAGNVRLLDAPGPIKNVVAFGDKFIVFKQNSIFVGTFVGKPNIFRWTPISFTVGLSYPKAVTECDGKLFFCHHSGVYMYDGQGIRNIGIPAWPFAESYSTSDTIRMRGDDIHGNVYIGVHNHASAPLGNETASLYTYAYNCRTGLWSRQGLIATTSAVSPNPVEQPIVYGSTAEYRTFLAGWGNVSGFAWIDNNTKLSFAGTGSSASDLSTFTTGKIGQNDGATSLTRFYTRIGTSEKSTGSFVSSASASGFHNERNTTADTTATATWNTTVSAFDCTLAAKYKTLTVTFATSSPMTIYGVGIDDVPAGRR